ncbi:hypothetical protein PCE1_003782 [Barthelona sp. PCE]
MLHSLYIKLLNKFLGPYLSEDLTKDQVDVALGSGYVSASNMDINVDALNNLGLPLLFNKVSIRNLTTQLSLRNFWKSGPNIVLDGVDIDVDLLDPANNKEETNKEASEEEIIEEAEKKAGFFVRMLEGFIYRLKLNVSNIAVRVNTRFGPVTLNLQSFRIDDKTTEFVEKDIILSGLQLRHEAGLDFEFGFSAKVHYFMGEDDVLRLVCETEIDTVSLNIQHEFFAVFERIKGVFLPDTRLGDIDESLLTSVINRIDTSLDTDLSSLEESVHEINAQMPHRLATEQIAIVLSMKRMNVTVCDVCVSIDNAMMGVFTGERNMFECERITLPFVEVTNVEIMQADKIAVEVGDVSISVSQPEVYAVLKALAPLEHLYTIDIVERALTRTNTDSQSSEFEKSSLNVDVAIKKLTIEATNAVASLKITTDVLLKDNKIICETVYGFLRSTVSTTARILTVEGVSVDLTQRAVAVRSIDVSLSMQDLGGVIGLATHFLYVDFCPVHVANVVSLVTKISPPTTPTKSNVCAESDEGFFIATGSVKCELVLPRCKVGADLDGITFRQKKLNIDHYHIYLADTALNLGEMSIAFPNVAIECTDMPHAVNVTLSDVISVKIAPIFVRVPYLYLSTYMPDFSFKVPEFEPLYVPDSTTSVFLSLTESVISLQGGSSILFTLRSFELNLVLNPPDDGVAMLIGVILPNLAVHIKPLGKNLKPSVHQSAYDHALALGYRSFANVSGVNVMTHMMDDGRIGVFTHAPKHNALTVFANVYPDVVALLAAFAVHREDENSVALVEQDSFCLANETVIDEEHFYPRSLAPRSQPRVFQNKETQLEDGILFSPIVINADHFNPMQAPTLPDNAVLTTSFDAGYLSVVLHGSNLFGEDQSSDSVSINIANTSFQVHISEDSDETTFLLTIDDVTLLDGVGDSLFSHVLKKLETGKDAVHAKYRLLKEDAQRLYVSLGGFEACISGATIGFVSGAVLTIMSEISLLAPATSSTPDKEVQEEEEVVAVDESFVQACTVAPFKLKLSLYPEGAGATLKRFGLGSIRPLTILSITDATLAFPEFRVEAGQTWTFTAAALQDFFVRQVARQSPRLVTALPFLRSFVGLSGALLGVFVRPFISDNSFFVEMYCAFNDLWKTAISESLGLGGSVLHSANVLFDVMGDFIGSKSRSSIRRVISHPFRFLSSGTANMRRFLLVMSHKSHKK